MWMVAAPRFSIYNWKVQALVLIHSIDISHVIITELEVKNFDIFLTPNYIACWRYCHNISLYLTKEKRALVWLTVMPLHNGTSISINEVITIACHVLFTFLTCHLNKIWAVVLLCLCEIHLRTGSFKSWASFGRAHSLPGEPRGEYAMICIPLLWQ